MKRLFISALCSILFTGLIITSSFAQSGNNNFSKIQTILNRVKGKTIGSGIGNDKILGQTFTANGASLIKKYDEKGGETYSFLYSEVEWRGMSYYFRPVEKNEAVYELTIKLKGAAKITSMRGKETTSESYTVEIVLYLLKADFDETKSLLDAMK